MTQKRMTLSDVVDKLTTHRQPSSSLTLKFVTTGPLAGTVAPELEVSASDDAATVSAMVTTAVTEFRRTVTELAT